MEHVKVGGAGGLGGCIQIWVIMRAGAEPRCLPERKQFGACVFCAQHIHYVCEAGRELG